MYLLLYTGAKSISVVRKCAHADAVQQQLVRCGAIFDEHYIAIQCDICLWCHINPCHYGNKRSVSFQSPEKQKERPILAYQIPFPLQRVLTLCVRPCLASCTPRFPVLAVHSVVNEMFASTSPDLARFQHTLSASAQSTLQSWMTALSIVQ